MVIKKLNKFAVVEFFTTVLMCVISALQRYRHGCIITIHACQLEWRSKSRKSQVRLISGEGVDQCFGDGKKVLLMNFSMKGQPLTHLTIMIFWNKFCCNSIIKEEVISCARLLDATSSRFHTISVMQQKLVEKHDETL